MNYLYYGDNLDILGEYICDESVDLIYLDPPFNSKRNYNVLFKDRGGAESAAQVEAFRDSWSWGKTSEDAYHQMVERAPAKKEFPKIQLLTIENLLRGKKIERPPTYLTDKTFKRAEKYKPEKQNLDLGF